MNTTTGSIFSIDGVVWISRVIDSWFSFGEFSGKLKKINNKFLCSHEFLVPEYGESFGY